MSGRVVGSRSPAAPAQAAGRSRPARRRRRPRRRAEPARRWAAHFPHAGRNRTAAASSGPGAKVGEPRRDEQADNVLQMFYFAQTAQAEAGAFQCHAGWPHRQIAEASSPADLRLLVIGVDGVGRPIAVQPRAIGDGNVGRPLRPDGWLFMSSALAARLAYHPATATRDHRHRQHLSCCQGWRWPRYLIHANERPSGTYCLRRRPTMTPLGAKVGEAAAAWQQRDCVPSQESSPRGGLRPRDEGRVASADIETPNIGIRRAQ